MAELADALRSGRSGYNTREGSNPSFGTWRPANKSAGFCLPPVQDWGNIKVMMKFLQNLKRVIDLKKLGLVVVAAVLFFLVMDLNSRLNELSRLTTQRDDAATVVSNLEGTLQVLQTQQAYAGSEGAVAQWAYSEGHMVRPGEQLVVPISPPGITVEPIIVPTPTVQPVENWEIWLAMILGE